MKKENKILLESVREELNKKRFFRMRPDIRCLLETIEANCMFREDMYEVFDEIDKINDI